MKIVNISIKRKVTVTMFTIAVILFGLVSFSRLKLNLLPELTYPTLTIRTEYEGAAPLEVENLISKPIEERLGVVKNVLNITSNSSAGRSDVTLEFAWGTDMDFAGLDIREKLDMIYFPKEAKRPLILRYNPSMEPILRYGLYTSQSKNNLTFDESNLKRLRKIADEDIKRAIEIIPGIASIKISGGLEDEISIVINQGKTAQLNLSIEQISNVLALENINYSGGILEEGINQYLVRTVNQFQSLEDIKNVIIAQKENSPIYLKDIADIKLTHKKRNTITRLDGKESVEIAIYKEGDANTVAVAKAIKKKLEKFKEKLPDNTQIQKIYDQSLFISDSVNEVINAGIFGGLLAILILYFFLKNFWITFITSLSIPISVIATFNLMYSNNISLNIMSLGGITLGIGMLLDNSIVVLENISRHREEGMGIIESAQRGASEVGMAVTASTLTTVAVFFPLVFVKGIAGQLFKDQALTVTFSLIASLVVAVTLIPMLASIKTSDKNTELAKTAQKEVKGFWNVLGFYIKKVFYFIFVMLPYYFIFLIVIIFAFTGKLMKKTIKPALSLFDYCYNFISRIYPIILKWALNSRFAVISIAILLFGYAIFIFPKLGIELIPQLSQGEFIVELKLPSGTSLSKTDNVLHKIQNYCLTIDKIATSFAVSGNGNKLNSSQNTGINTGDINITLKEGANRDDENEVMDKLRKILSKIPDLTYNFKRPTLFSFKPPLEVEISGYNLNEIEKLTLKIADKMEKSNNFTDIKHSVKIGQPELSIRFNRERAALLKIKIRDAANILANQLKGKNSTQFNFSDTKIDVIIRGNSKELKSIEDVKSIIINPNQKRPITLGAIAEVKATKSPAEILRSNQQRVAIISSNIGSNDLGTATIKLKNILKDIKLPQGININITGQNSEMNDSFKSLKFALIMAIFLVYLVMASQFESFIHPFVILFSIPLAFVGAILALYITGYPINVVVFIGGILLAGIVVNNAIVLIDLINQLREKGIEKIEAIINAGKLRLRSILMTTLTTTLGLLPLALGVGKGSELRAPMAITVIGGLLVSTLLTLIVIPVVYSILDRKKY